MQVGNIGPEGAFMIAEQLSSKAGRAQAKLQGRTMVVYFEREGELYKLEASWRAVCTIWHARFGAPGRGCFVARECSSKPRPAQLAMLYALLVHC